MKLSSKKAALEKQIAQIEKDLRSIEKSAAFKKENAVARALNNLMRKHGCSKNELISILQSDEEASKKLRKKANTVSGAPRKPRKLKIFRNPNTGETVETRGGNHKILKAWKADYNLTSIDDWLESTRD